MKRSDNRTKIRMDHALKKIKKKPLDAESYECGWNIGYDYGYDDGQIDMLIDVLRIIEDTDEYYELWALKFQKVKDNVLTLIERKISYERNSAST